MSCAPLLDVDDFDALADDGQVAVTASLVAPVGPDKGDPEAGHLGGEITPSSTWATARQINSASDNRLHRPGRARSGGTTRSAQNT
ncbi:MAG: hypothetical protein J2P19_03710 [Pseudonocardia sp.]|nr:hypothetical protein [Pseudonocardia sp.]